MKKSLFLYLLALTLALPVAAQQKKRTPQKTTATARKKTTPKATTPTVPQTKQIKQLKSESAALKTQIAESEKLLRSTKKDVQSQLSNLMVINTQIGEQQKYVEGISSEINVLGNNLVELERHRRVLLAELAECKRQYRRAVDYMFRNRFSQSKWLFILKAQSFNEMRRRLRYVQEFGKFQRAQGEVIRQKEEEVRAKEAEIRGVKHEKTRLMAEGKQEQRKLEGQKQERQQVVNELNRKQAELQKSIAQTRQKYNQLNARIDRLIQQEIAAAEARRRAEEKRRAELARQEAARKERERRAAELAAARRNESAGRGRAGASTAAATPKAAPAPAHKESPREYAADNADRQLSNNFAANRGRLPVPITGSYSITSRFGAYNVEGLRGVTLDNKGINLTGHSGAQARSVFDGEVTAVFSLGGLYNVIVRHGSYISVYCNLSGVGVRQGQKVSTRQSLGSVARDAAGNYTLHFQLRRETATLNPEAWIGR